MGFVDDVVFFKVEARIEWDVGDLESSLRSVRLLFE